MRPEAAAGGPIADQFRASAISVIEKPKAFLAHATFSFSQLISRACFIVGVRDATTAYLFLLCYVIQDRPLHRSWSAL